jgi:hypothetical protein
MTLYLHTGEGTDAVAITTSNAPGGSNNWAGVTKNATATNEYDTAQYMHGSSSILLASPTTGTDRAYFRWDYTAQSAVAARVYARFSAWPTTSSQSFIVFNTSGSTRIASVALTTSGYLLAQDSTASTVASSGTVALDTWHRIEAVVDRGASTVTVRRYVGESTSIADSATFSAANLTPGDIGMTVFGKFSTSGTIPSFWFDSLKVSTGSTSWIGPEVVTTPVTFGRHVVIG